MSVIPNGEGRLRTREKENTKTSTEITAETESVTDGTALKCVVYKFFNMFTVRCALQEVMDSFLFKISLRQHY